MTEHLLVSCVKSKSIHGPHIGDLETGDIDEVYDEWRKQIRDAEKTGPTRKAKETYTGTLWSTYENLHRKLKEIDTETKMWVVSAGLGLIPGEKEIPGYGATFSDNKQDSISSVVTDVSGDPNRSWWKKLTNDPPLNSRHTLPDLLDSLDEEDRLWMVMGSDYHEVLVPQMQSWEPAGEAQIFGIKKTKNGLDPKYPSHLEEFVKPYSDYRRLQEDLDCPMTTVHPNTALEYADHLAEEGDLDITLRGMA